MVQLVTMQEEAGAMAGAGSMVAEVSALPAIGAGALVQALQQVAEGTTCHRCTRGDLIDATIGRRGDTPHPAEVATLLLVVLVHGNNARRLHLPYHRTIVIGRLPRHGGDTRRLTPQWSILQVAVLTTLSDIQWAASRYMSTGPAAVATHYTGAGSSPGQAGCMERDEREDRLPAIHSDGVPTVVLLSSSERRT